MKTSFVCFIILFFFGNVLIHAPQKYISNIGIFLFVAGFIGVVIIGIVDLKRSENEEE